MTHWHTFIASQPAHRVVGKIGSVLLTACGLNYNEACARKARGRKCRNCRKSNAVLTRMEGVS